MQSFRLLKPLATTDAPVSPFHEPWKPTSLSGTPVASINDIDSAMAALTEAEQVIRSQEEHIRQLENMALTDELTGLFNRRGFTSAFQRELALARRDIGASGVLVMIDLDDFKAVNDKWGHTTGDGYLQGVAHTLLGAVRTSDVVARLGGDEFAILFTRMNENTGIKRLAKLEKAFNSRTVTVEDKTLLLSASFGLTTYRGVDAPEAILAAADHKLYAQKTLRRSA